jgi:hypothetical protein
MSVIKMSDHRKDKDPDWRYYEVDGRKIPSVTQILSDVGISPNFSNIDPDVLSNKAHIGTLVHEYAKLYLTASLAEIGEFELAHFGDPRVAAYCKSWLNFYETLGDVIILRCEEFMRYKYLYAGTPDALIFIMKENEYALCDWKTRPFSNQDRLQTAAYLSLARNEEIDGAERAKRWIVELRESGMFRVTVLDEDCYKSDIKTFEAAARVWHVREQLGRNR